MQHTHFMYWAIYVHISPLIKKTIFHCERIPVMLQLKIFFHIYQFNLCLDMSMICLDMSWVAIPIANLTVWSLLALPSNCYIGENFALPRTSTASHCPTQSSHCHVYNFPLFVQLKFHCAVCPLFHMPLGETNSMIST